MNPPPTAAIQELLAAAGRVTGLRVILRDLSGRSGLGREWVNHLDPACAAAKARPGGFATCIAFCAGDVLRALAAGGAARIHTCPHGHTEIAVPVLARERFLGVLFAGPCHTGPGPAAAGLVAVPDPVWLADRLALLDALALRLALLLDDAPVVGKDRESRIVAFIEAHLDRPLALAELAAHLELSTSRCGHHIKELFGVTFPALVRRTRMQVAARLLSAEPDLAVGEVAHRVGCQDLDWFTRHFRIVHGCSPVAWRRRQGGA